MDQLQISLKISMEDKMAAGDFERATNYGELCVI